MQIAVVIVIVAALFISQRSRWFSWPTTVFSQWDEAAKQLGLSVVRRDVRYFEVLRDLIDNPLVELRFGATRAIAALPHRDREAVLAARCADKAEPVRLAAVQALGHCGSLRAVETLVPFTSTVASYGGLREAAREAVRRIQQRESAVGSGGLSLVESNGEVGSLSMVDEGESADERSITLPVREPHRA